MNSNEVIKKKDFFTDIFQTADLLFGIYGRRYGSFREYRKHVCSHGYSGGMVHSFCRVCVSYFTVVTFFLQKMWAFGDVALHPQHALRQAALYTASSVSFLGINTLMLYLLVGFRAYGIFSAQFFSLGIVALGSFLFNKSVTFSEERD